VQVSDAVGVDSAASDQAGNRAELSVVHQPGPASPRRPARCRWCPAPSRAVVWPPDRRPARWLGRPAAGSMIGRGGAAGPGPRPAGTAPADPTRMGWVRASAASMVTNRSRVSTAHS
jgi:hypothetical protein